MLYVNPMLDPTLARAEQSVYTNRAEQQAFEEMERLFALMLLREMRKGVSEDVLYGDSASSRMFHDLMDDAMAGHIAESGQLGIARMLEAQHIRQQEALLQASSSRYRSRYTEQAPLAGRAGSIRREA